MEEKISGRSRNIFVYMVFLTIVVVIVAVLMMGEKQNKQYMKETQMYISVDQKMREGKFKEAEESLQQLLATHPNSYMVMWKHALALATQHKYKEANDYFIKAQKQRPFIVRNQSYLMQYGDVLYRMGDYAKAKKYFEEAKKLNSDPQLSEMATSILKNIENKLQSN